MAELQETILKALDSRGTINTADLAHELNLEHQAVVGAVKSIELIGEGIISTELVSGQALGVTGEGQDMIREGSHEAKVFGAVPAGGILQADLMRAGPWAKIGFSKAMSSGWVALEKRAEGPYVTRKLDTIEDTTKNQLADIVAEKEVDANVVKELKKRKLVETIVRKSFQVTKGPNFTTKPSKLETDLTSDLIASGEWKSKQFKPYNFNALGVQPNAGHLHPLLKVRAEFRAIFLEMGFVEMPTNNFVESSFWNFDALFQPQQHPARDSHDTFFIKDPENCLTLPEEAYVEVVKNTHQTGGGFGSIGYRYDWKLEEGKKNILRTHTTAVSARMLKKLADEKPFKPAKYFSIDRVFRNETLDATHLAEFHQIEGVIADYNLTLGDLIGVLNQFFSKSLGIKKLRFKPAYNPYTEPSMEIFSYHEGLGKWVEIGNSGMFRPEMLEPMGLPKDVSVIAWGLSLERPTMIKYKIDNIRELVGHKVNLEMVYNNALCRLLKE